MHLYYVDGSYWGIVKLSYHSKIDLIVYIRLAGKTLLQVTAGLLRGFAVINQWVQCMLGGGGNSYLKMVDFY